MHIVLSAKTLLVRPPIPMSAGYNGVLGVWKAVMKKVTLFISRYVLFFMRKYLTKCDGRQNYNGNKNRQLSINITSTTGLYKAS
jgi:hypothetical protein